MANLLSKLIFDKVGLQKNQAFLDLAALRTKLIGGNIANVSTPGYESKDINFEKEYASRIGQSRHLSGATTHKSHIPMGSHPAGSPKINEVKVRSGELNSVDIDKEVSSMAKNELLFTIGARLIQKKFEGLRNVITSK